MRATTSKQAWKILQLEFQGNSKVKTIKLQGLRRELENLKMKDSETAKEYCSKLIEVVNQMRAYGEPITDERIVQKILISLTEKYDSIVTAIEESRDLSTLSVTELMGSLQAHEQRLDRRNEATLENAFQLKVNLKNKKQKDFKKRYKGKAKYGERHQNKYATKGNFNLVVFARKLITWRKIAFIVANLSVQIAKSLAMKKRIAGLKTRINKQIS